MNVSILTTFAAEETTGIGALGLDWKAMLLQAGTFLILFFIFKKFALDKVVKVLDDRHNKIEESLNTAHEIEKRAVQTEEEEKKILSKARKEADQVIVKAKDEASEIISEAEVAASKKQDKILADAQSRIDSDIKEARSGLKSELLGLVAQATSTLIDEKVDAKKDQKIIEKALGETTK